MCSVQQNRKMLRQPQSCLEALSLNEADRFPQNGFTGTPDCDQLLQRGGCGAGDADVANACLDALAADKFVPKGSVIVGVSDKWVTLRGTVRHQFQRRAAVRAVRQVEGVLGVKDNLVIGSEPVPCDVSDRIVAALRQQPFVDDSLIVVSNSCS